MAVRFYLILIECDSIQGELFEILEDDKCLPEDEVQKIAKQLVLLLTELLIFIFKFHIYRLK